MTGTCTGACCAVFPLDGWSKRDHAKMTGQTAYIRDMVLPLTLDEATQRFRAVGFGDLPAEVARADELYTCRHWDVETHLCAAYEARPDMCRHFPYGHDCAAGCGFQVDRAIAEAYAARFDWSPWRWDARVRGYRLRPGLKSEAPGSSEGWRWDPDRRTLYPVDSDEKRWNPRRRKWEAVA